MRSYKFTLVLFFFFGARFPLSAVLWVTASTEGSRYGVSPSVLSARRRASTRSVPSEPAAD